MNIYKKIWASIAALTILTAHLNGIPKITLIIVVDQLSYQSFNRLTPYFTYGLKDLMETGTNFTSAHHPHGNPTTATGYATISTGAYAKAHGIVLDEITAQSILVPTLSDQILQNKPKQNKFTVYALANTSAPARAMAGKLGKAVWFDETKQQYTSSSTYFANLPQWLNICNKKMNRSAKWLLCHSSKSPAYQLPMLKDFRFAALPQHESIFPFEQTPNANEQLIQLCKACIDAHKNTNLVLWVGFTNFETIGNRYGPTSLEAIDLLYHLDKQLDTLIAYARKKVGKKETCIVFTAAHGCSPIPEQLKAQGFYAARRIQSTDLQKKINSFVYKKYGLKNSIAKIESTQIFFDKKIIQKLKSHEQNQMIHAVQKYLLMHPGIKHCWTKQELTSHTIDAYNLEQYYQNQCQAQRSGDLILMPFPYTVISTAAKGTAATSAYSYDTQVPLLVAQKGIFEKRKVANTVYLTQLAPTIASILNIQLKGPSLK